MQTVSITNSDIQPGNYTLVNTLTGMTDLPGLVDNYRLLAGIEGKSPKTISTYTTALNVLDEFLELERLSKDVTRIGVSEMRGFISYLQTASAFRNHPFTPRQGKGLTGHTISVYLRAIRAFWSWLESEELIDTNPFDKVVIPKPPEKVVMPFSGEQIHSLLSQIDTSLPIGFRDWLVIVMLLDTGLRVAELEGLKIQDVDLNQRSLRVKGKGNRERVVPFGSTIQLSLVKYLNRYRPLHVVLGSDHLFVTRKGRLLTANRIEALLKEYGIKAGIKGVRCSPHTLRHTFAVSYLRNGGDAFSLQLILGHSTLEMVRRYIYLAQSDLQEVHLRCSPVDILGLNARKKPVRRKYGSGIS